MLDPEGENPSECCVSPYSGAEGSGIPQMRYPAKWKAVPRTCEMFWGVSLLFQRIKNIDLDGKNQGAEVWIYRSRASWTMETNSLKLQGLSSTANTPACLARALS